MSKKRKSEAYYAAKKAERKAQQKKKYIRIGIIAVAVLAVLIGGILLINHFTKPAAKADPYAVPADFAGYGGEKGTVTHVATLEIENYGTVVMELYGNDAPHSVYRFVALAESGFYNGLKFHRIIDGFMMQGGGNKDVKMSSIRGEFAANGIENTLLHDRGAVSFARTDVMDSATSQFFIVHKDSENNHLSLDSKYACFGYVVEGMDVVDAVIADAQPVDWNGSIAANAQPVIQSLTITKK